MFLFIAVFLFSLQFFPDQRQKEIKRSAGLDRLQSWSDKGKLVQWLFPFIQVLQPLVSQIPLPTYRKRLQQWLTTAAMDQEVTPDHVLSLHVILPLIFLAMGKGLNLGPLALLLAVLLGAAFPVIWIYQKKKNRQANILRTMPDIIDMVSLTIEAGMAFQTAVERVCDLKNHAGNSFVEELNIFRQNIRIGMSREEALQTMAQRVDLHEIHAFCSILIQAEKMGASISATLKDQAAKMRQERFMQAERQGAMASQVLMVPLVLFILPILFVIIIGPFILKFIYRS